VETKATAAQTIDPRTQPSGALVGWLSKSNGWAAARARRVRAERRDPRVVPRLKKLAITSADDRLALEALWALAGMGAFDEELAQPLFGHRDEAMRTWAVRLVGERGSVSPEIAAILNRLAESDPSAMVRAQLASTAKRLPPSDAFASSTRLLARREDRKDRAIPLLVWWAIEAHAAAAREEALAAFATDQMWANSYAREEVLGRLMRRYAAEGTSDGFAACARLMESAPDNTARGLMFTELDAGLALVGHERRPGLPPGTLFTQFAATEADETQEGKKKELPSIPPSLAESLVAAWRANRDDFFMIRLMLRLGSQEAEEQAVALALDVNRSLSARVAATDLLGALGGEEVALPIATLINKGQPAELRRATLLALSRFSQRGGTSTARRSRSTSCGGLPFITTRTSTSW
jgi:hypothetical protein